MPQLIIAERASSRERGTDGLQRSLDPSVFSTLGSGVKTCQETDVFLDIYTQQARHASTH